MASVAANGTGLVFVFEHDEVEDVVNGAKALGGTGGLVTGALAAAGVTLPAALVTAVVSAYFGAQAWLIKTVDKGCGIYLTLPWVAVWFGQVYLIIPTTRPCDISGPRTTGDPDKTTGVGIGRWSDRDAGELHTEDPVDTISWAISRGANASDVVVLELEIGYSSSGWKKVINMPDGQGSSWDIEAEQKGSVAKNALWANQVHNGQMLTFRKAKAFGILTDVLRLGDLDGIRPGDTVRFTWVKDS